MKYLRKYEFYDSSPPIKYIGKYVVFYWKDLLFCGKVESFERRLEKDRLFFMIVSQIIPNNVEPMDNDSKMFYLENVTIIDSFDSIEEAKKIYNIINDTKKYNL